MYHRRWALLCHALGKVECAPNMKTIKAHLLSNEAHMVIHNLQRKTQPKECMQDFST